MTVVFYVDELGARRFLGLFRDTSAAAALATMYIRCSDQEAERLIDLVHQVWDVVGVSHELLV